MSQDFWVKVLAVWLITAIMVGVWKQFSMLFYFFSHLQVSLT